ncbi:MAG: PCMD domain-containing protein, partial [Phocaeicola sp.]
MLTIAFDDEVVMQPIDIATINAAAPKFTLTGIAQGETLYHSESADKELTALLSAVSGVKKVKLKIQSAYLANLGIPQTEIDLTDSANQEIVKQLSSLGLEIRGLSNLDKMVWFDFSKLMPQLQRVDSQSEHLFTISVVDNIGKTCEDLSFSILSVNNPITVSAIDDKVWNVWDKLAYLTLQTPGDIAKVKAYLLNESGKEEIAMSSQLISNNTYQVELALPGAIGGATVSFELGSSTDQLSLTPFIPAYTLELSNSLAVWAKQARLRLKSTDAETEKNLLQSLSLVAAEGKLSYYEEGEEIVLTGLTPATNYIITPQCAGIANNDATLAFTTEEALQVPNGDMEDWYYTRPNNVKYWEVWYATKEGETSVWNTLNLKTTSEGGTNTGAFAGSNRNGCRYNANSGTIQTEDRYSGEYAALIRAVGWGKGNSAVNSANAKYGDPGYLYLGSYNSDTQLPNYDGIPFSSRPTSLSYYYKYTPGKDGDSYLAEIALLHKNGD